MGRRAAIFWHAALSLAAGVLYFFFVLPRWPELMGDTSHGLGTAARIAAGIMIALAALPVVFTLLAARKPEFGTPALALTLRTWSIVTHVAAGVLIVGTAISEIWLSLDSVGQWLFGVYGAAAAVAVLGIAGFYLSFVAESPPPPPKPLKPKKEKKSRRGRGDKDEADETTGADKDSEADEDSEDTGVAADEDAGDTDAADDIADEADDAETGDESPAVETTAGEPESTAEEAPALDETGDTVAAEPGGLRNRRPSGKVSHRRRRVSRPGG
jgi:hypothetical protein